jgi:DNA-binding MarR family transcriptional regulator
MLMLDPNNCVLLLNDLDEAGYVERRRDPADRRRHIVQITPEGLRALEQAEAKLEELEDEVLGNLDSAERQQLQALLVKALDGQDASVADCSDGR